MRHGRSGCGAVPMFFAWREPDHIAGMNFFHRPAFALDPTATGGNDQRLPQRMRVPGGARARLECDARARHPCGRRRLKQRVNPHRAGKPVGRATVRWLRAHSFDFHLNPFVWQRLFYLRRSQYSMGWRSRKKPPVGPSSGNVASHTAVSAPASGVRGAATPVAGSRAEPHRISERRELSKRAVSTVLMNESQSLSWKTK
jgi:hypothetical protein